MALVTLHLNPSRRELRQFAILCLFGFVLLGALLRWQWGLPTASLTLWVLAPLVAAVGLAFPPAVRPLYVGLSVAAYPLGWVVSHIVMGLTYFVAITAVGVLLRRFGRDALGLQFDRAAKTYWLRRKPTTDLRRYFRQF